MKNCTTTVDRKLSEDLPEPKDWSYRLLLNGALDELLYERGLLVTGGLPFAELKQRAKLIHWRKRWASLASFLCSSEQDRLDSSSDRLAVADSGPR
jgi:hypothetical protein